MAPAQDLQQKNRQTNKNNNGSKQMDRTIKVVVVGDGTVGKTCLLLSYSQNAFPEDYVPTVFDNYNANVMWQNKTVQLQLWDTAGQEDYDKLRPLSYPETDVFILCFDVTNQTSFENIRDKWVSEVRSYCPNVPIILCGTKSDLRDSPEYMRKLEQQGKRMVSQEEAQRVAAQLKCVCYIECSAKTQHGLKKLFEKCIECILLPQIEMEKKRLKVGKFSFNNCQLM